jgi:hypothetical protein
MVILATVLLSALLPQEAPRKPAPARRLEPPAEIVLAPSADPVPLSEFGLGDGGIGVAKRDALRWTNGGCTTAGGVRIECRAVGVKLTFPSGRELLVAPDGILHLRSGETAGPFPTGVELRLGDGATVRVSLSASSRARLRDVEVLEGDRVAMPWRNAEPATWVDRPGGWAGPRFFCCGDGGDVYRAVALGPLLVLERVLVADDRAESAPTERLVVLTAALRQSFATMTRQHKEPDAPVRRAVRAVEAVSDRSDVIFPAGSLHRARRESLRWLLTGGYELELQLDGPQAPRLGLFEGQTPRPLVEWTLHAHAAAYLGNPRDDRPEKRWHANGTRLPAVASDLQAREHLFERGHALRVIGRLRR